MLSETFKDMTEDAIISIVKTALGLLNMSQLNFSVHAVLISIVTGDQVVDTILDMTGGENKCT